MRKEQEFTQKADCIKSGLYVDLLRRSLIVVANITADLLRSVFLVNGQSQGTTANFIGIATTGGVALGTHTGRWGSGVSAIAFGGKLGTSIGLALSHAVINALLNSHTIVGKADGECARSKIIPIDFRGISKKKSRVRERKKHVGRT